MSTAEKTNLRDLLASFNDNDRERYRKLCDEENENGLIGIHFWFPSRLNAEPVVVRSPVVPQKGDKISMRHLGLLNVDYRLSGGWVVKEVYYLTYMATSEKDKFLGYSKIYGVEVYLKPIIRWKLVLLSPWYRLKRFCRKVFS